ncbi:MAG TPA: hypothetical protein ENN69_01440, partial [Spirochaetia bacterium]|nr:hypothetical protein [Spirochaetia bacterium]
MLFMRTWHLVAFVVLIIIVVGVGAGLAYARLSESGAKVFAEEMFFYALIGAGVIVFFCVRILIFGVRTLGAFDKVLDLVKQQGVLPLSRFEKFGRFGRKMQKLYEELADLGERKSSRIQQQNVTISMLLQFIDAPLLLVDITGEIRKGSGGYAEKNDIPPSSIQGKPIT